MKLLSYSSRVLQVSDLHDREKRARTDTASTRFASEVNTIHI